VLGEKMLQFKLPAAQSFRIPAGEDQGFTQFYPTACYQIWLQKE